MSAMVVAACAPDRGESVTTAPAIEVDSTTAPSAVASDSAAGRWSCNGLGTFVVSELEAPPGSGLTLEEIGVSDAMVAERGIPAPPSSGWFEVTAADGHRVYLNADAQVEAWGLVTVVDGNVLDISECTPRRVTEPGFGLADWVLPGDLPGPRARSFPIEVTEIECASGQPADDRLLPPEIVLSDDAVTITVLVATLDDDERTCQGNPSVEVEIELPEPLGDRMLLDGSTYPHRLVEPAVVDDPIAEPASVDELPFPVARADGSLAAPWITLPVFGADDGMYVQIRRCADQHLLEPDVAWDGGQLTLALPITPTAARCDDVLPTDVWVTVGRSVAGASLLDGATNPPTPVAPPPDFSEGSPPTPPPPAADAPAEVIAELVVVRWPAPSCTAHYSPLPGLSVMGEGPAFADAPSGLAAVLAAAGLPRTGWLAVSFAADPAAVTYLATLDGATVAAVTFVAAGEEAILVGALLCAGLPDGWAPDGDPSVLDPFLDRPVDPAEVTALLARFPELDASVRMVLAADPAPLVVEVEVPLELRCDVMVGIEELLRAEGFAVSALETAELEDPTRSVRFAAAFLESRLVTVGGSYSSPVITFTYEPQAGPGERPFSGEPGPPFPCGVEGVPG